MYEIKISKNVQKYTRLKKKPQSVCIRQHERFKSKSKEKCS